MIRIRIPAIREIKGDIEMPAKNDKAVCIGQSPRWTVLTSHSRGASRKQGRDILHRFNGRHDHPWRMRSSYVGIILSPLVTATTSPKVKKLFAAALVRGGVLSGSSPKISRRAGKKIAPQGSWWSAWSLRLPARLPTHDKPWTTSLLPKPRPLRPSQHEI